MDFPENEKEAKKGSTFDKEVVHFRGRHFDEWLTLAMDVSFSSIFLCTV